MDDINDSKPSFFLVGISLQKTKWVLVMCIICITFYQRLFLVKKEVVTWFNPGATKWEKIEFIFTIDREFYKY